MEFSKKNLSVAWTNYSANISSAFNELLKQNELIDVTLVAEDCMFDAHRLVLSALSPYFRRIFTQMPVSQQAFVFLTGVSKHSLDSLLQYIYNGQVNIKEENLETFLKTAEAFGIKGLNKDNDHSNSAKMQPTSSSRFESNRPLNASQYQSVGINKRKLVTHSGHQNKDNISTPNWTSPPCLVPKSCNDNQSFVDKQFDNPDISLENPNVFDDRNTPLSDTEHEKHKRSANQGLLTAKRDYQPEDRKEGYDDPPANKRAKRTNRNDLNNFKIVADIRKDAEGRENLYHENQKFCQHDKTATTIFKRWICTLNRSAKCRAIIKTTNVDGVTMMQIVRADHTH